MDDIEMLEDALEHEETAVNLYREYGRETDNEAIQEMFEQFAMNESWHAAALRAKIEEREGG
ncbi:MAG: ferritin family protein [Planctomycetota bacterium]